jgi:hypothetical protein
MDFSDLIENSAPVAWISFAFFSSRFLRCSRLIPAHAFFVSLHAFPRLNLPAAGKRSSVAAMKPFFSATKQIVAQRDSLSLV